MRWVCVWLAANEGVIMVAVESHQAEFRRRAQASAHPTAMTSPLVTLHIQPQYLALIASGRKPVEGRLARPPYSDLRVGQHVTFADPPSDASVTVSILSIARYRTFAEMLETEGLDRCLPDSGLSLAEAVEIYRSFPGYRDGEEEFGALVRPTTDPLARLGLCTLTPSQPGVSRQPHLGSSGRSLDTQTCGGRRTTAIIMNDDIASSSCDLVRSVVHCRVVDLPPRRREDVLCEETYVSLWSRLGDQRVGPGPHL